MQNNPQKYPKVKRNSKDEYEIHGHLVKDPYRWLEDPHSQETQEFVASQNLLSTQHINTFPHRSQLKEALTEAYNYEKLGCPFKRGSFFYFFHNSGLLAQSVLYRSHDQTCTTTTGESESESDKFSIDTAQVFFDPNKLSLDGTASLATYSFSKTGNLFAYGVSYSGSDWETIKIIDTSTCIELKDTIEWVKFSGISWTHDERGFFYLQYPKPSSTASTDAGTETDMNTSPTLLYHVLGTPQSSDIPIYHDANNPTHMFGTSVTDDGKYLVMKISNSCDPVNKLYILDIGNGVDAKHLEFIKIVDDFSAEYAYVANHETCFILKTNIDSPRYKVVKYDLKHAEKGFLDFIPQTKHVLQEVYNVAEDKLVTVYMEDCKNTLKIFDMKGKSLTNLKVDIGSLDSFSGRKEDYQIYFKMSSFLNPGLIYKYDFNTCSLKTHYVTNINISNFKLDDYKQEQVFYNSADGAKIPMFVVSSKDCPSNSKRPVYLYGYGGFNIPLTPMFSPQWLVFVKMFGGILAIANIRGGGEYGDEWHKAGCLKNKQCGFDDFQYAAKYLVESGLTSHDLISINGGSNGGLLVAACVNQAPELFGCAIAEVGVLDMLRFHKFTIGHAWRSDYGDPEVKEDFEYLLKYSPVHTVSSEKTYPAILLMTSDHDDRVVPLHSYKYIATLQHAKPDNPNPLLIRVDTKSGHGKGKPTAKRIDEAVDRLSFMALSCKVKPVVSS